MKTLTTKIPAIETKLFYAYGLLVVLATLFSFVFQMKVLLVIPVIFPMIYLAISDFRKIYFALLFLIPLSFEFQVTESLGTDLPTEPLMIGLMLSLVFYYIKNTKKLDFSFFKNPIMLLLVMHLFWIFLTSTTSLIPSFSFKFLLAKIWYVFAFTLATATFIKSKKDLKKLFWVLFIPMSFTVIWALIRHSFSGFHFDAINPAIAPFYRNHVVYANLLSIFLPFIFLVRTWYAPATAKRRLLNIGIIIFLAGIYFSYTRAAYLAVIAMSGAYFIINYKAIKLVLLASVIGVIGIFSFITHHNYYLKYSPSVKTVSQHELSDIIDATLKGTDVSSMERIYRWIAAIHMANDRPITGFGPNGFVSNYKNYTVFIFETWISDNEERSGVHNYFLMTLVEQGIPGLLLFIALLVAFFIFGENLYHHLKEKDKKATSRAIMLSMVAIVVSLIFSDMIEVDKTGSFFFINLALIVLISRNYKGIILEESNHTN